MKLYIQGVELDQMILKSSMVIPRVQSSQQASVEDVARSTVKCLLERVPAAVPSCAFLSGGQRGEFATAHLNVMNVLHVPDVRARYQSVRAYQPRLRPRTL